MAKTMLKVLIFLSMILYLDCLSLEECQQELQKCRDVFLTSVQQNAPVSTICQKARSSVICSEELMCESEIFGRIGYRSTEIRLSELRIQCELGVFPTNRTFSTAECKTGFEKCMQTYLDAVVKYDVEPRNDTLSCQNVDTFAGCLVKLETCGSGRSEVEKFVSSEKLRLKLANCETPSLNAALRLSSSTSALALLLALVSLLTRL